jgi:hypothetical protein
MDDINIETNCVITECGHKFHCSCLLKNASHNGFGCPYCRTSLAEEVIDEEDEEGYYEEGYYEDDDEEDYLEEDLEEDYEEDYEYDEPFQEVPLESFRMFHQRLNGEEVEEGTEIMEEPIYQEDYDERAGGGIPNAEYVSRKLLERGISHKDLVKSLLAVDHDDLLEGWAIMYREKSSQVYGQIRKVIHQSKRNYLRNINQDPVQEQIQEPVQESVQEVAEEKTSPSKIRISREFIRA